MTTMQLVMVASLLLVGALATSHTSSWQQNPRLLETRMRDIGGNARNGPNLEGGVSHHRRPTHKKLTSKGTHALADYILPSTIVPIAYDIQLIPYLETPVERAFTFDGETQIRVRAASATNTIVLHAWDLEVSSVQVVRASNLAEVAVTGTNINADDTQFFTIDLSESLVSGQEYLVTVQYTGVLNDEGFGFFRSAYEDANGNTKWLTATQFESTGARRAFPCFDQPDLKATFTMHIATEPGWTALANMPIETQGDPVPNLPGWQWNHFELSVPMSTYLVAFSTNQFASMTSPSDARFKVWARPNVIQNAAYASEISPALVGYYEAFTGVPFHLPKFDQIGMTDFFSGAMENWGLIAYVEDLVIYDDQEMNTADKQLVAAVISHETAHQWHGDLVSPKWWNYLWLNEGFATYFEYFGTAAVGATWELDQQFVVDMMQTAFISDSSANTHPINADVDSPNSIDSIFDAISYNKGGCLVRFMVNLLGEEKFKAGINNYLIVMGYRAAEPDDLYTHLSAQNPPLPNGVSFKQVMDSWTNQGGYPVITVIRNYTARTATVSQTRFGAVSTDSWYVPLTYTSAANPNFENQTPGAWLLQGGPSVVVSSGVPADNQWLMFNLKQTGFYRVNYDDTNWGLIADYMTTSANANSIHPTNRIQLLDDSFSLASSGLLSYTIALRTTAYLNVETSYAPWLSATFALEYIRDRMYHNQEGTDLFQSYMQGKLDNVYRSVAGFNSSIQDGHVTRLTRRLVTNWACAVGHSACNIEGAALFQQWQQTADPDNNNPVDIDLRPYSYCAGVRQDGQTAYDFIMARYQNSGSFSEQSNHLRAMGCSSDPALLQAYLDESISPSSSIKSGDELAVFFAVYRNPLGVDLAFDFLVSNWLVARDLYNVGRAFRSLSEKLNTQSHYDRLDQFRNDNLGQLTAGELSQLDIALANVQTTLDWNSANQVTVMDYFRQQ